MLEAMGFFRQRRIPRQEEMEALEALRRDVEHEILSSRRDRVIFRLEIAKEDEADGDLSAARERRRLQGELDEINRELSLTRH
jgi:hypothetical protein